MKATVTLFDRLASGESKAEVFDDVSLVDFVESQDKWRPVLWAAANILRLSGQALPRYKHWDWRTKKDFLGRLDVTFFGLKAAGVLQGLMKVDTGTTERCRTEAQKGQELVYVDYVETAPWNIQEYMEALGRSAWLARVGVRLMQAAVQLSIHNELKGRVGLHSLPDAEGFYSKIGMTAGARDPKKQNLLWFEFSPESAKTFMETYL